MMRAQFGPLQYAGGGFAEKLAAVKKSDEEAFARMQNEPYYDPVLAARVSRLLGPGFQSAFDPRRKRYIKTESPLTTAGLYRHPDAVDDRPTLVPFKDRSRFGESTSAFLTTQPDTLYAFGPTPNPNTIAHEYRHRAGIISERDNRLYDALYAETPEDWKEAVKWWQDWVYRDGQKLSLEEAEKNLTQTLDMSLHNLRDQEYNMAPKGQKPRVSEPSLGGFLLGAPYEFMVHGPAPYRKFIPKEKKADGGLAQARMR